MRVTLELTPAIAARLEEMAAERGEDLTTFLNAIVEREAAADKATDSHAQSLDADDNGGDPRAAGADGMTAFERRLATNPAFAELHERVRLTPERIAERQARTIAALGLRRTADTTGDIHEPLGEWPGDETDEELLALERMLDDEDAGRRSSTR